AAGAAGAGAAGALGPGVAALGPGVGAADGAAGPGVGADGWSAAGVAGALGPGLPAGAGVAAAFLALGSAAGGLSFTRRTTGASIVELADFTNSPMSPRWARRALLETPSSLASSWTRTLATFLLHLVRTG